MQHLNAKSKENATSDRLKTKQFTSITIKSVTTYRGNLPILRGGKIYKIKNLFVRLLRDELSRLKCFSSVNFRAQRRKIPWNSAWVRGWEEAAFATEVPGLKGTVSRDFGVLVTPQIWWQKKLTPFNQLRGVSCTAETISYWNISGSIRQKSNLPSVPLMRPGGAIWWKKPTLKNLVTLSLKEKKIGNS